MTTSDPRLGMVAGEPSGDLLAQLLLGGLKQRWPALQSFGLGGPQMQTQGFDAWWNYDLLAVHGYSLELLLRLRRLFALRAELGDRLLKARPDAFIGVDAPDFNLGLEARLKKAGTKTIHFVSPSIWAWRGGRIHKIREAVDHVLCLFPFEPEIYQRAGIAASYVGHPLADAIPLEVPREAARTALGLPLDARVIALLPGSRRGEVRHIAPALLGAAARLAKQNPGLRFVLPAMRGVRDLLDPMVAKFAGQFELQVLDGRSHEALAACDLTLIASGTATLEAALFKRPMVITYNMHWLSWIRMQGMAYQPWVGLPNILLRGFVVPELLQDSCTPEAVAQAAQQWLDSPSRCEGVGQRFAELHHLLRQDTARRASDAVAQVLGR
ncbi:lipid-A-disaccharide synthase [Sphaerotilus natans subsp. natans DSM 6575]|uniref:Lipid-A-disaccharide synthase n=1 Tax=Sphaerotilus natans subsp. natans DSM 6575 TaxID=1286631 RepID=A0A059KRC5_9BURK|nr:lipid-A-disaccharide synthase [Sphaerotilus natans]KDB53981.1 lipid-A-disaccharide synthase [Sphaerotilus natans subsp. natans DSM 6575]SIS00479.1 lipid-A-disaccharide synthase [Sphaerotilus natans]